MRPLQFSSIFVFAAVLVNGCSDGHMSHSHAAHGGAVSGQDQAQGNPHSGYCPVMGGKIDAGKANDAEALHFDYKGKRFFFCCEQCKPKFEEKPEKFIENPADPVSGSGHSAASSGHTG